MPPLKAHFKRNIYMHSGLARTSRYKLKVSVNIHAITIVPIVNMYEYLQAKIKYPW